MSATFNTFGRPFGPPTRIEHFGDFNFSIPTVNGLVSGEIYRRAWFFPGDLKVAIFRRLPRFVSAKLDFYGMGVGYPTLKSA